MGDDPLTERGGYVRVPEGEWRRLTATIERLARPDLERTFRELADKWRRETAFMSSVPDRIMHPAYQRIIGLGPAVIPILLRDLEQRPSHWFWALKAITGEDPVKPEDAGAIQKMADAWMEWGRQRGYL